MSRSFRSARTASSSSSSSLDDDALATIAGDWSADGLDVSYLSGLPAISFSLLYSEVYRDWKAADDAAQRLDSEQRALAECIARLNSARDTFEHLDVKRLAVPGLKRRKSSLLHVFGKGAHGPAAPPIASISAEALAADRSVLELEADVRNLERQVDASKRAVLSLDPSFEALRRAAEQGSNRRYSTFSSLSENVDDSPLTRAEKSVAAREAAYAGSQDVTTALRRACRAVQSAHFHYRQAMDLMDVVCSPTRSRLASMMGDEQSREATYKEAANIAQKAQVCFNECVRTLEAHMDLLQTHEVQLCEDLREAQLLQAVRMYELMYGGKALAFGIAKQQQMMLQKQEGIFARLTDLAVAVQNCTVHCGSVERAAREKRDAARRRLVSLWVGDCAAASPLSPV